MHRAPSPARFPIPARSGADFVCPAHIFGLRHVLLPRRLAQSLALPNAADEVLINLLQLLIARLVHLRVDNLPSGGHLLVCTSKDLHGKLLAFYAFSVRLGELHPWMGQRLCGRHSLLRVVLKDTFEEVEAVLAQLDLAVPSNRLCQYLDHDVSWALGVVRILPILDQVEQDAERPDIGSMIVLLADQLGGEVVRGSTQLGEHLALLKLASHSEVYHLDLRGDGRLRQHKVLCLDVAVGDLHAVDVFDRTEHLLAQGCSVLLAEPLELHNLREDLPTAAQLHHHVQKVQVLIEVVVAYDVLMLDALQQPDFSDENRLIRPLSVVVVALNHLHSTNFASLALQGGLANLAEGAATENRTKLIFVTDVLVSGMVARQALRADGPCPGLLRHGAPHS
mmetsp:Transcript_22270/g.63914  ORF Transcript_22270/g.63914 Transcript_22270/m.63914 type:complete len:394 (+) Transcript_22270:532-1713(+)